MSIRYPIVFKPILKERIWGGYQLQKKLGKEKKEFPTGESWEVSALPDAVSVVQNGPLNGKNLQELTDEYQHEFVGDVVYEKYGHKFPLLIKFIAAEEDLSLQLHPDNELARSKHNSLGKEEFWYIMDTEKDAKLYLGFSETIDKDQLLKKIKGGKLAEIIHHEPVYKGKAYHIPPGRIHAIGKGIVLAEIQQASDITYRLFDWNRKEASGKPRELHIDLALDAIDFQIPESYNKYYPDIDNTFIQIEENNHFKIKVLKLTKTKRIKTTKTDSFTIYMCVEGSCTFLTEFTEENLAMGSSIFIPAYLTRYTIRPEKKGAKLLYIKAK